MMPRLMDAGLKLFLALVDAVIKATPQIIDAVIKLIPMIVDALIRAVPQLIDAGIQLLTGLAKGMIDNAPRILGTAIASVGNTLVNGVKGFLGIKSPSRVFYEIGENVGQGLINGMQSMFNGVKATAEQLAALAAKPTVDTLNKLGITSTYSGYGVPNLIPTTTGELFDVGRATDDLNAIYNYMGAKTIDQMEAIKDAVFGGSFQQAIDTLTGQQTFINPKTGMSTTVGGTLSDAALERILADGFKPVETLGKSADELKDAIESLAKTVDEKGLLPAGVALATGGYVDRPTPALVGEAGPEVVMPLDRFEKIMGLTDSNGKTLNYYAAPNQSIDAERDLFQAMRRAKVVTGW